MDEYGSMVIPAKRRTDHLRIPKIEIDRYLKAVEMFFTENWLCNGNGKHRLQKLWQRSDTLSTIELLSLGHALVTMEHIDYKWVKDSVREIRRNDNNCHGFLFELLACTMFASAGMTIRPMPDSFPGYDAEIIFDDGFKLRVSMKNHDMSAHERKFQERSATLRWDIIFKLKKQSASAQVVIQGLTYLDKPEFVKLREAIANAREIVDVEIEAIPQVAAIGVKRFSEDEEEFAEGHVSDTVIVLCPQHQNEQKKFCKKVKEAAYNLRKNTSRPEGLCDGCNVIMMRLHPSASLDNVEAYALELLNSSTDNSEFDAILLYQPSVVRQGESTMVSHFFRAVLSQRYIKENHQVRLSALIGGLSTEPSQLELQSTNGVPLLLTGNYVFQRGDHYLVATKSGDSWSGNVTSPAPGIHVHAVFGENMRDLVVSGKYHDNEELTVI